MVAVRKLEVVSLAKDWEVTEYPELERHMLGWLLSQLNPV